MASLNIRINDRKITAESGQTVLAAASAAGIEIPTLCHHPALKPIGACRLCLVEIKGQRGLQPACTFPATRGMAIQTESPRVVEARKFVLELIFSERNHFCMVCEMSGDCELQKLGYRYGLDHWMYPTYTQNFPVDASAKNFLLDHNRCVLCRRCVRACSELAANHTLDLRQRGALTMLTADMNVALAQSSCISCGVCLDVCPTGALVDKRSAFLGRDCDSEHIASICSQCSVGCGVEIVTRANSVLRIRGRWDAPVNAGVLCQKGRFESLGDDRSRILSPLKRLNGTQLPADWDDLLQLTAERLAAVAPQHLGLLTSTLATNEVLHLLNELFCRHLMARYVDLMNPVAPSPPSVPKGTLADLSRSDCIVVTGTDPVKTHPVASMLIRRSADHDARLIVIEDQETALAAYADQVLKTSQTDVALRFALQAQWPVVVYGNFVSDKVFTSLKKLVKAAYIALQPGVNTHAAVSLGLHQHIDFASLAVLYVLAGEQHEQLNEVAAKIAPQTFVVVQASYASPLTRRADLVLPTAIWLERSGSLTNTDGIVQKVRAVRAPQGQSKPDWEIVRMLIEKLGGKPFVLPDDMAHIAGHEFFAKENPSWQK